MSLHKHIHTAANLSQILQLFKGLNGTGSAAFVAVMQEILRSRTKVNKLAVEKIARGYGITEKNSAKEYTELAIVNVARELAHQKGKTLEEKFFDIVDLYKSQVNLSHRTSESILKQQYSTPAPIGYIAGIWCGIDTFSSIQKGFEPSAGNGLLTIAGNPASFDVNDYDELRSDNLRTQGFNSVTRQDATKTIAKRIYDVILTNPPFGKEDTKVNFDGYEINTLEHIMSIRALEVMKDSGRAAFIIGGHTKHDERGRIQAGKNRIFFNYLYNHYNVSDVININGDLYSRQGTSFDVRLILIHGRKQKPEGYAPLYNKHTDVAVNSFEDLYSRVMGKHNTDQLEIEALAMMLKLELLDSNLGMAYIPASKGKSLQVDIPDSMGYEMQDALKAMTARVGNIDQYVTRKLKYDSTETMHAALASEQVDAVALAIYNIEEKKQGVIIGDQTGIGKGRQAAAMIRYGAAQGLQPIFCTEKPNLFSDLYRDLKAIGSEALIPFIVNGKEAKTQVKDEDGNVVYEALDKSDQDKILKSANLPHTYNYVMLTYSQISGSEFNKSGALIALSPKANFVRAVATDNILILDEAHNASGESNTGRVLQNIVEVTKGVTFLSATFAKRPDNMPLYAMKTAMQEANMTKDDLVAAITKGGVALQEVLSSQLVKAGQLIRRERSFEGIEVNYITLDSQAVEHKAIYDNLTSVIRDIINYQTKYINPEIEALDKIASAEGKEVEKRAGTRAAGVDNAPYFSKAFQVVNQMLFAIKAEAVADRAILRLQQGKKPVIAFSSTMGSFLESMEDENGMPVGEGSIINADFATSLMKGLDSVMRYSEVTPEGKTEKKRFDLTTFSEEAQNEYNRIADKIHSISSGIVISPIDIIKQKLAKAGYTVAEVTGRKLEVEFMPLKKASGLLGTVKEKQYCIKKDGLYLTGRNNQYKFTDNFEFRYTWSESEKQIAERLAAYYNAKVVSDETHSLGDKEGGAFSKSTPQLLRAIVKQRKKENTNDAFRRFNNNEVDVLMINQSGSTGASAHAVATKKVPARSVGQRCMILLQAELDINTEVQKRGRINRTGQILKPIYDYVFSAIPAEKRLMMMLQKKLKSLDANTTSNQKNSEALLKSDDFLNKYGDKIAADYCKENIDFNKSIDDPLKLNEKDSGTESNEGIENAASRVSGRVAVLSTIEQEAFYEEILRRYNDYIDELKQTGDYDLEVEYLDLNAKQLEKTLIKGGKGGKTAFGDNTYLEKTEINNLKKPLKLTELQNIITDVLGDSTALEINAKYITDLELHETHKLSEDVTEINRKYEAMIQAVKDNPEKIKKEISLQEQIDQFREAQEGAIQKAETNHYNKLRTLTSFFKYLTIGKALAYQSDVHNESGQNSLCVFCGFKIDYNARNPFAPSNIKANFAIASPIKFLSIPLSKSEKINSIIGASRGMDDYNVDDYSMERVYQEWSTQIRTNSGDRTTGYILTGNILQVFGAEEFRGAKLVQYTCMDAKMRKGALLPFSWSPTDNSGKAVVKVQIPIFKALKAVKAMAIGSNLYSGNLSIIRSNSYYQLLVPRSRKSGGDIYLDADIIKLTRGNNFNTISANMVGIVDEENIGKVCKILQDKHSISVELHSWQLDLCKAEIEENKADDVVTELPEDKPSHATIVDDDMEMLEMEAMALKLKLELLDLAA